MEEKELWMNKLKEKLEDYSEPIPASGWEQLEKELMPPVERKIYPYRKWMMAAAAVILLALVSSVSLYFLGTPAADEIRHTQTPALASVPDALPAVQQPDAQGATADPVSRPMLKTDRLAKTEHNISEQNTYTDQPVIQNEDEFPATDDKIDNGEKEETKLVKDANAGQKKQALETEEPRNNRPRRPSSRDKYHIPTEKKSSQKGTWSMGFAVGNYKMIQRVEILPYHTLGVHKYEAMEQEYKLKDVKENTPEQLEKATEVFKKYFTTVVVN